MSTGAVTAAEEDPLVRSWGKWHDRESNKDKATLQILVNPYR